MPTLPKEIKNELLKKVIEKAYTSVKNTWEETHSKIEEGHYGDQNHIFSAPEIHTLKMIVGTYFSNSTVSTLKLDDGLGPWVVVSNTMTEHQISKFVETLIENKGLGIAGDTFAQSYLSKSKDLLTIDAYPPEDYVEKIGTAIDDETDLEAPPSPGETELNTPDSRGTPTDFGALSESSERSFVQTQRQAQDRLAAEREHNKSMDRIIDTLRGITNQEIFTPNRYDAFDKSQKEEYVTKLCSGLTQKINELNQTERQLKTKLASLDDKTKADTEEIARINTALAKTRATEENYENQLTRLMETNTTLLAGNATLAGELDSLLQQLKTQEAQSSEKISTLTETIDAHKADLVSIQLQLHTKESLLIEKQEKIVLLEEATLQNNTAAARLNDELSELRAKIQTSTDEHERVLSELAAVKTDSSEQITTLKQEHQTALEDLTGKFNDKKAEIDIKTNEIQTMTVELTQSKEAVSQLQTTINELQSQLTAATAETTQEKVQRAEDLDKIIEFWCSKFPDLERLEGLRTTVDEKKAFLVALQDEMISQITGLVQKQSLHDTETEQQWQELQLLINDLTVSNQHLEESLSERRTLETELKEINIKLAAQEEQSSQLHEDMHSQTNRNRVLQSDLEILTAEIDRLESTAEKVTIETTNRINTLNQEKAVLDNQLILNKKEIEALNTENQTLSVEKEHLEQHLERFIDKAKQDINKLRKELRTSTILSEQSLASLIKLEDEHKILQGTLKHKDSIITSLKESNQHLDLSNQELKKDKETLEKTVGTLDKQLKASADTLADITRQLAENNEQLGIKHSELDEANKSIEELKDKLVGVERSYLRESSLIIQPTRATLDSLHADYSRQLLALQNSHKTDIEKITQQNKDFVSKQTALQQYISKLETTIKSNNAKAIRAATDADTYRQQITTLRSELEVALANRTLSADEKNQLDKSLSENQQRILALQSELQLSQQQSIDDQAKYALQEASHANEMSSLQASLLEAQTKVTAFLLENGELTQRVAALTQQVDENSLEIQESKKEIEALRGNLDASQQNVTKATKDLGELLNSFDATRLAHTNQVTELEARIKAVTHASGLSETEVIKLKADLEGLTKKNEEDIEANKLKLDGLSEKVELYKSQEAVYQKQLDTKESENRNLIGELNSLKRYNIDLKRKIEKLGVEKDSEKEAFLKQLQTASKTTEDNSITINTLHDIIAEQKNALEKSHALYNNFVTVQSELSSSLALDLEKTKAEAGQLQDSLNARIRELEEENSKLTEQVQEFSSQNDILVQQIVEKEQVIKDIQISLNNSGTALTLAHSESQQLTKTVRNMTEEINNLKERLSDESLLSASQRGELESQLSSKTAELHKTQQDYKKNLSDLNHTHQNDLNKIAELKLALADATQSQEKLKESLSAQVDIFKVLLSKEKALSNPARVTLDQEKKKLAVAEKKYSDLLEEQIQANEKITELTASTRKLEEENTALSQQITGLVTENADLKRVVDDLNTTVITVRSELEQVQGDSANLLLEITNLSNQYQSDLAAKDAQGQAALKEQFDKKIMPLETKLNISKKVIQKLKSDEANLNAQILNLTNENRSLRDKFSTLEEQSIHTKAELQQALTASEQDKKALTDMVKTVAELRQARYEDSVGVLSDRELKISSMTIELLNKQNEFKQQESMLEAQRKQLALYASQRDLLIGKIDGASSENTATQNALKDELLEKSLAITTALKASEDLQVQLDESSDLNRSLLQKIQDLTTENTSLKAQVGDLEQEVIAVNEKLEVQSSLLSTAQSDLTRMGTELTTSKENLARQTTEIASLKESHAAEMEEAVSKTDEEKAALLAKHDTEMSALQNKLTEAASRVNLQADLLRSQQESLDSSQSQLIELNTQLSVFTEERETLKAEIASSKKTSSAEKAQLLADIERQRVAIGEGLSKVSGLSGEVSRLRETSTKLQTDNSKLREDNHKLIKTVSGLTEQVNQLKKDVIRANRELEEQRNISAQDKSLITKMRSKTIALQTESQDLFREIKRLEKANEQVLRTASLHAYGVRIQNETRIAALEGKLAGVSQNMIGVTAQLKDKEDLLKKRESVLVELTAELTSLQQENAVLQASIKDSREVSEAEKSVLTSQLQDQRATTASLTGQCKQLSNTIKETLAENEALRAENVNLLRDTNNLRIHNTELKAAVDSLGSRVEELNNQTATAQEQSKRLTEEIEIVNQLVSRKTTEADTAKKNLQLAKDALGESKDKLARQFLKIKELKQSLSRARGAATGATNNKINRLKTSLKSQRSDLKKKEQAVGELQTLLVSKKWELYKTKEKLSDLTGENNTLKEAIQTYINQNKKLQKDNDRVTRENDSFITELQKKDIEIENLNLAANQIATMILDIVGNTPAGSPSDNNLAVGCSKALGEALAALQNKLKSLEADKAATLQPDNQSLPSSPPTPSSEQGNDSPISQAGAPGTNVKDQSTQTDGSTDHTSSKKPSKWGKIYAESANLQTPVIISNMTITTINIAHHAGRYPTNDEIKKFEDGHPVDVISPAGHKYAYSLDQDVPKVSLKSATISDTDVNADHKRKLLAITVMNMIDNVLSKSIVINLTTTDPFIATIATEYIKYLKENDSSFNIQESLHTDPRVSPSDDATKAAKSIFNELKGNDLVKKVADAPWYKEARAFRGLSVEESSAKTVLTGDSTSLDGSNNPQVGAG